MYPFSMSVYPQGVCPSYPIPGEYGHFETHEN